MASMVEPLQPARPNIPTAGLQLPAVQDYEQVDREIGETLNPTKVWFGGLALAIFFLLIGLSAFIYQTYYGLGVAGYEPPVMWGVYIITFVFLSFTASMTMQSIGQARSHARQPVQISRSTSRMPR